MPDFGSFRGFGEKLTQGQTPTQLGLIGSFGVYDIDAQDFFIRVTNAGGTLSSAEIVAVNQLVLDMKAAGVWTAMKAVYPIVGASAAACAQNLKSSSFTGVFTSGWTFASTGVTPNGSSAFMNTNLNANSILDINSTSIGIYSRTEYDSPTFGCDIGANTSSLNTLQIIPRSVNTAYFDMFTAGGSYSIANATSLGMFVSSTNSTQTKFFRNGGLLSTFSNSVKTKPDTNILLSSRSGTLFSQRELSFAHIGDSLTNTQASDFYTAVQAFQTTLSRQV
jgi:hypothetical protein